MKKFGVFYEGMVSVAKSASEAKQARLGIGGRIEGSGRAQTNGDESYEVGREFLKSSEKQVQVFVTHPPSPVNYVTAVSLDSWCFSHVRSISRVGGGFTMTLASWGGDPTLKLTDPFLIIMFCFIHSSCNVI